MSTNNSLLLSNDDGINAAGLKALELALTAYDCVVLAPDRNRSACSSSLTLSRPLQVVDCGNRRFKMDGTPADCVHVATHGFLDVLPVRVVSGINMGANLGDDVIYSGTLAAAFEGRFLAKPAVAISIANFTPLHYDSAIQLVKLLMPRIESLSLPQGTVLNINIPDLPYSEIKGIKVTRLGKRYDAGSVLAVDNPRGGQSYWIGAVGESNNSQVGTDFHAIAKGYVSITPLHVDMTQCELLADLDILTANLDGGNL